MPVRADRVKDDLILNIIELRAGGMSSYDIAYRFELTPEFVRTATNRVMKADLKESWEGRDTVLAHYW